MYVLRGGIIKESLQNFLMSPFLAGLKKINTNPRSFTLDVIRLEKPAYSA